MGVHMWVYIDLLAPGVYYISDSTDHTLLLIYFSALDLVISALDNRSILSYYSHEFR